MKHIIAMKHIITWSFFILIFFSKSTFGATESNIYNIELVVFTYKDCAFLHLEENLNNANDNINLQNAVRIQSKKYYLSKSGLPSPLPPIYLSPSFWKLNDKAYKVNAKNDKRIIYHVAWQQELPTGKQAAPVYVERILNDNANSFMNPKSKNNAFQGVLDIKNISNSYQVKLDFVLDDSTINAMSTTFRLKADGLVKDNEAYYFEQGAFGALVLVSKAN